MAKTPPKADMLENGRGWTEMHDDLAAWINEQVGYEADSTTIGLAFALRNEYRKTDRYEALRAARADVKAQEEAARAAERQQKADERAAAKIQREAEKVAKAEARARAKAEKDAAAAEKAAAKAEAEKAAAKG